MADRRLNYAATPAPSSPTVYADISLHANPYPNPTRSQYILEVI